MWLLSESCVTVHETHFSIPNLKTRVYRQWYLHISVRSNKLRSYLLTYFLGPRKKLLHYLDVRKAILEKKLSGLEEYQATSVTNSVQYRMGPAGTGQPSVIYPKLDFEPSSFYALGSPIALFNAVRGINALGANFKLPTCPKFFNIFHPYDPVAYRVESLIDPEYATLRPGAFWRVFSKIIPIILNLSIFCSNCVFNKFTLNCVVHN